MKEGSAGEGRWGIERIQEAGSSFDTLQKGLQLAEAGDGPHLVWGAEGPMQDGLGPGIGGQDENEAQGSSLAGGAGASTDPVLQLRSASFSFVPE
jgi:hypothetical protein